MNKQTEAIDRLFLELSQATTAKELAMRAALADMLAEPAVGAPLERHVRPSLVERLLLFARDYTSTEPHEALVHEAVDELERLERRLGQAADKALTYAESYEMAVARCVLALDYMHPEQKRAFNEAWSAKRAELRALKA